MPVQITPSGSNLPLDEIPEVEIEEAEARDAIDEWNALFVRYFDLLRATVEFHEYVYDVFSFATDSGWVWNDEKRNFHNLLTLSILRPSRQLTLREGLIEKHIRQVNRLAVQLRDGQITVQKFTEQMQERIKRIYTQQFSLAKGGLNTLTALDTTNLSNQIGVQNGFLQNFSEQIRDGRLSYGQINNRAGMYMHSSTQAYERGKASSYRLDLPEYPADGNQICLSNCKCHWNIVREKGFPVAYWILDFAAEHCESCVENSKYWNPFRG